MRKNQIKDGVRFSVECEITDVRPDCDTPGEKIYDISIGGEFVGVTGFTDECKAYRHFKVIAQPKKPRKA